MRVLLLLLLLPGFALADYEETEFRLKTAGVAAPLRKRIHAAINRGVAYLLEIQAEDGHWPNAGTTWRRPMESETVYAALALRHAGTAPARRGVRKALRWLYPEKTRGKRMVRLHVYLAGAAAMLLHADRSHPERLDELGAAIANGQGKQDWWGYVTAMPKGGGIRLKKKPSNLRIENLSTAQFAALGLWAANRGRKSRAPAVWQSHLQSLIRRQMRSGSWRYAPVPPWDLGGYGYDNGTFMGLANLLLAEAGSDGGKRMNKKLREKLIETKRNGLAALDRDAVNTLQLFPDNTWSYYGLYALEKAALFSDREELGGVRWYVEGATKLCDLQDASGAWGRDKTIDTVFALLFLLRSSRTYHPTTPRETGRPEGPVSGTAPSKPAPEPEPAKIPVDRADMDLQLLIDRLKSKKPPAPESILALADVDRRVVGDPKRVAAWRIRWVKLCWQLLRGKREPWGIAGAQLLTRTGRGDAKNLRALVKRKQERSAEWWTAVVGELFPTVATPDLAEWIAKQMAKGGTHEHPRSIAALRGLRLAAPKLPWKCRRELIDLLLRRFEGIENHWNAKRRVNEHEETEWDTIGAHAICAMRELARDPQTGAYPFHSGRPLTTCNAVRDWLRK
ncbi:MAG: prenyltransferase/squalene oxidase repeat-containing protein [Planctomycetota bacterium]